MALVLDTFGASNHTIVAGQAGSISVTPTIGSGANRAVVAIFTYTETAVSSATISGAGGTWTDIGSTQGAGQFGKVFALANPSSGAQTITVTFLPATTGVDAALTVWSFSGADQTTPVANYASKGGPQPVTLQVAAGAGDIAVAGWADGSGSTATNCNAGADDWNSSLNNFEAAAHCAGPSPTFGWSSNSDTLIVVAAAVQAAAVAVSGDPAFAAPIFRSRMREW